VTRREAVDLEDTLLSCKGTDYKPRTKLAENYIKGEGIYHQGTCPIYFDSFSSDRQET
jgi:hypothetical protein